MPGEVEMIEFMLAIDLSLLGFLSKYLKFYLNKFNYWSLKPSRVGLALRREDTRFTDVAWVVSHLWVEYVGSLLYKF